LRVVHVATDSVAGVNLAYAHLCHQFRYAVAALARFAYFITDAQTLTLTLTVAFIACV
jgi:hypothetical protein